ncbi:MAG: type IX secretion system membrane protein PorP/SprF [Bacteroidetes bacterium]|nr:type IX secretion system membrane protein PorP/SprF [Bacteroidota bacterium]
MKPKVLTSVLFCFFWVFSYAQDIHWSQFNNNQMYQNPSQAGYFDGDYRFIGNYRDQWRSVTVPFSTFSTSFDARYKKWGIGVLAFHDQAGDGKFRTIEIQGNISRSIKLAKDSSQILCFGLNFGMNHRQINWDLLYFDNQYNGYIFDPSAPTNENFQTARKTNASVGLGSLYEWNSKTRTKLQVGIGAFNLNQPDQGFYTESIKRDIRFNGFAKAELQINPTWDIITSLQYSQQGIYNELIFGSSARVHLTRKTQMYQALYFGLWNRSKDAFYPSIGYEYNDFFVGLSYDINYSKLVPASNMRGGIEVALRYVVKKFKPKRVIHRVCPDYI